MTVASRVERIGDATLYLGDALEIISEAPPFDAVVTDPPYMMGSASTRSGKGFRSKVGDWTNASFWYAEWMRQCWSRLPASGSMWICGNWRTQPVLTVAADSFGASISSVVVWDKDWIGVGPQNGLRQRYELVFQLGRPDFGIPDRSLPDIWREPWSSQRPSGHESEKPVGLMQRAIETAAAQTTLDPFMGGGTTGVACAKLRRRFTGIEIEPAYFDIACRRIEEAYRQPRLFDEPAPKPVQDKLFGDAA